MNQKKNPEPHIRRIFEYDYRLLPNRYLCEIESGVGAIWTAIEKTGYSIGYPAWNLLYYSLFCSLPIEQGEVSIIETGTNQGFSTIILAQALHDSGHGGFVYTVDIDKESMRQAKNNVARAGLKKHVKFRVGDSLKYLRRLVEKKKINFAFLDSGHHFEHVRDEFAVIHPAIVAAGGTVYFDNTTEGGVAEALKFIKENYGGNLVEFRNCSWSPPGNAIWQP